MSEGSSVAVYLAEYLGWSRDRIATQFATSQRIYQALGIHHRLLNLGRAARVYLFSEWAREVNVRWGADPEKLAVIYPGFATPPLADRSDRETFTFLFVGRDFERKGGYDVIEAFAQLARDLPQIRLVLAGADPSFRNPDLLIHSWVSAERRERLEAELENLIKAGRAIRLPQVSQAELRTKLFPQADAFVMPTNAEGFGFTNVEAMSFGLPVITSNVGPAPEIVANGESGVLVSPGDVAALTETMHRLAVSPARAIAMGNAGRGRFEARFTRERFRRELGALYRSVAEHV
jgi:glycosyltransferase involved in cell wall biosynthesis